MRNLLVTLITMIAIQVGGAQGSEAAGYAQPTGQQGMALPKTVTGMPYRNSYIAPGNLALQQMRAKKLPATRLDSFVKESGYNDLVYGDEGTDGPPPYLGFEAHNRIDAGIYGDRDQGLTTNHASELPSAWGKDEFIGDSEWKVSGPTGLTGPMAAQQNVMAAVQNQVETFESPWQDVAAVQNTASSVQSAVNSFPNAARRFTGSVPDQF